VIAREIDQLTAQLQELRGGGGGSDFQGKSKDELLKMVKETTGSITDTDKMIQEEQRQILALQNELRQLENQEGDLKTERGQQYLKLLQRENEMKRFIESAPDTFNQVKTELLQCQHRVYEILVAASKDLVTAEEMPSPDHFKGLQVDLMVKERMVVDAQSTAQTLQREVEMRKKEYEELKNIDKHMENSIAEMKQQMKEMNDELPNFADVDTVREEGEARKKARKDERDRLKAELHSLRKATNSLAVKFNETKQGLRGNEIELKLQALEKEIRARAAEMHTTAEGIEENRRRSNYSLVKRASLAVVQEINSML
jgi:intraflagellar transport protein 74